MTKLEQIKAECRKAIELGEAALPGPWEAWENYVSDGHKDAWINSRIRAPEHRQMAHVRSSTHEGTFIAHARTFSPAAARALLVAIEALEEICSQDYGCRACENIEDALEKICQQWPDPVQGGS